MDNWEIVIEEYSKTPKYKQIVNSIISGIERGHLELNDKLPSVNRLLIEFDISRDTVVRAYDHLKEMGIIDSIPGKGYYIKNTNIKQAAKVFLAFNKLSPHKKIIYDSFIATLGDEVAVDFFIYNNNFRLFKELIRQKKNEPYTHYAIIPHFIDYHDSPYEIINELPKEKLFILDKKVQGVTGEYAAVYQDFEANIYDALTEALDRLKKYERLKIIFPPYGYHPIEIVRGFEKFCTEFAFEYQVVENIETEPILSKDVFINLMENDLVILIKRAKLLNLVPGKDFGIISYNETPLKEILLDGITTISTDFGKLGETAAKFILEKRKEHVSNPFYITFRNSL